MSQILDTLMPGWSQTLETFEALRPEELSDAELLVALRSMAVFSAELDAVETLMLAALQRKRHA